MTLYKLDLLDRVLEWTIEKDSNYIITMLAQYDGTAIHTSIPSKNIDRDIKKRISDKLKEGWIELEEVTKLKLTNLAYTVDQVRSKLSPILTDKSDRRKPQLAILFKENKAVYPSIIQPKLNGVRCNISWEKVEIGDGFFKRVEEGVIISSKNGEIYHLPHIASQFKKEDFILIRGSEYIEITYDGELYNHNMRLNEINSSAVLLTKAGIPSKSSGNPEKLQFWCYDLAIPNIAQMDRITIKDNLLNRYPRINQKVPKIFDSIIVRVGHILVHNDKEAREEADRLIDQGFEGGILRDFPSDYSFGSRTKRMMKLKKWFYTKCVILDIKEKNTISINNNERNYITVVLQNDLNSEIFESSILGDEEYRQFLVANVDTHIGKIATVRYRERSGKKNLPFQCSIIKIE